MMKDAHGRGSGALPVLFLILRRSRTRRRWRQTQRHHLGRIRHAPQVDARINAVCNAVADG